MRHNLKTALLAIGLTGPDLNVGGGFIADTVTRGQRKEAVVASSWGRQLETPVPDSTSIKAIVWPKNIKRTTGMGFICLGIICTALLVYGVRSR